ncbi:MAG: TauD/TfdA family dioxygenase, partial [Sphingomonadales bacterium]
MASGITHQQLAPFGIEVRIDAARGLSAEDADELRRLFARDGLLVVRGLELTLDDQLEFCSLFGPVLRSEGETYVISNDPEKGILAGAELIFHSDIPYVPAPYAAGALYAVEVTEGVSPTRFASGFRAYEQLSPALRARVDGRNSIQMRTRVIDGRNRLTDAKPTDNCAVQAVVGRQAESGRPYLFTGETHTAAIIGLADDESEALLEELFALLYAEENIHDHEWRTGDLVLWDNLAVQHGRKPVTGGVRTLQRVSIGQFAYWDQYPVDRQTFEALKT